MATAKQLPSGNWRVQAKVTIDGRVICKSFTDVSKIAAEYEAEQWQKHFKDIASDTSKMTVDEAITEYMNFKEAILSPSTLNGYETIRKNRIELLKNKRLCDLSSSFVQKLINNDMATLSPKTIKNVYGLILAVYNKYYPEGNLNITFPKIKRTKKQQYSDEYVAALLQSISGKSIEIPALISIWLGLRASEIAGIKWESIDFKNKTLHIERALIKNKDGEFILSDRTKTSDSDRYLEIPPYIFRKLQIEKEKNKSEFITTMKPNQYWQKLRRATEQAKIEGIRFHDLRHINASIMLAQGVNDMIAQERGGWSTNNIMKSVYQHTFTEQRKKADKKIDDYFNSILENNE